MYLLDTNVVSELRRPKPHKGVLNWIGGVPADRLFLSAVTAGKIQAGIEVTRERDMAMAEELASWLDRVVVGYGVLPMDAASFREWARLKHGKSNTQIKIGRKRLTASLSNALARFKVRSSAECDRLSPEIIKFQNLDRTQT